MQFSLKGFLMVAILLSVILVFPTFVGRLFQYFPSFFLAFILLFGVLLRSPQKFSFSAKEAFGFSLFLWGAFVSLSLGGAEQSARESRIKMTFLQLEDSLLTPTQDAWGNPLILGTLGFYSRGPNQEDDQGYYDDIGPSLSWRDALKKTIREFWIFRRSLFLFFSFGMIYGIVSGVFSLLRKPSASTSPLTVVSNS